MAIRVAFIAVLAAIVLALAACSGEAGSATTAGAGPTTAASGVSTTAGAQPATTAAEPVATDAGSPAERSELITAADVEKVSGLTGIATVERLSKPGAGGDVNFVDANGELVVIANFFDADEFDALKDSPNYREDLPGLGDAAFVGPSEDIMSTLYVVGFKKGGRAVLLAMFFKGVSQETMLTLDQLKELAGIVASRL